MTPPPNSTLPIQSSQGPATTQSNTFRFPVGNVSSSEIRRNSNGGFEIVTTRPLSGPFYAQTIEDSRGGQGWYVGIDLFKAFPGLGGKSRAMASKPTAISPSSGAAALQVGLKSLAAAFDYLEKVFAL